MRALERALDVEYLDPESAMRTLVAGTFEYQAAHERFVRLVVVENIDRGAHLERQELPVLSAAAPCITLGGIDNRGVAAGIFRPGVLHMTISALSFFTFQTTRHFRSFSS